MKKAMLIILAVLLSTALCFVSCKQDPPQPEPQPAHTHTFAEAWTKNETHHWHAATCEHADEKSGYAEHTWDAGVVSPEPTMTTDGVRTYTCKVCGQTKQESVQKLAICVSTFADFVQAFTDIREQGETRTTIYVTADLEWDATTYDGSAAAKIFSPEMTGLTLDLGGHSITGIANKAFAPTGNTFTIKNGSILLNTSLTATYQRALTIGFVDAMSGKDYTTEGEQEKAVNLNGINLNGCLYVGDGVFILTDCTISTPKKKTRGICCYSGQVVLNNSTVSTTYDGAKSDCEVAIYGREADFVLNEGTSVNSAHRGIQAYNNSTVTTNGNVTIQTTHDYALNCNYTSYTTAKGGTFRNAISLGAGANVIGGTKGIFALTWGDVVTIANGVTLTGPEGTEEPVYAVTSVTAAVGTSGENGYIGWSAGKGEEAGAASLTDNRVLE